MLLHLHPKPEAANKDSKDKHFLFGNSKGWEENHQDGMAHPQAAVFTAKSQAVQFLSQMLTTEGPTKKHMKFFRQPVGGSWKSLVC